MDKPERIGAIDFLRGIAIVVMIALHTQSYFLSDRFIFTLWSYGNFVVQIFIFTSAYMFFKKEESAKTVMSFGYFKKRFLRLMVPYYIFLAVYFPIIFFLDRTALTQTFVVKNVLLTGGLDLNWLVILFLYFMILLPILAAFRSHRFLFHGAFFLSLLSSCILFFYKPPVNYKLTMWLPWITVAGVAFYYLALEKVKKSAVFMALLSLSVFLITFGFLHVSQRSLVLFDNKYPPNIYYLSYGVVWIGLLLILYPLLEKRRLLMQGIGYFSRYSYTLFFIHFIVMYVLSKTVAYKTFGWFPFFLTVTALSVILQSILNRLRKA